MTTNISRYTAVCVSDAGLLNSRPPYRQCRGSSLYLLELSLDVGLTHAALRLDVKDGSVLLPGVNVQEVDGSSAVVLFATTSAAFRLVLPHPEIISKV